MSSPDVLGKLAREGAKRDAVHVAIVPVTCDEVVVPGEPLAVVDGQVKRLVSANEQPAVGIVDPFLLKQEEIHPGERFYLLLWPGSILSLRHEWTHRAFDGPEGEDVYWIHSFADLLGVDYDTLISDAGEYVKDTSYYRNMGSNMRYEDADSEDWEEFWERYERVSGNPKARELIGERGGSTSWGFFSCSC